MTCTENLLTLSTEDIKVLIEFVGEAKCRNFIIEYGKNQPSYSEYHIGKKNGKFWKGFRVEKLNNKKIYSFFHDQIKNENPVILEKFENLLLKSIDALDCNDESLKDKIMNVEQSEVVSLLLKLFNVSMDIPYQKYVEDINRLEEGFAEVLQSKEENYNKKVKDLICRQEEKIDSYEIKLQHLLNQNKNLEKELQNIKNKNINSKKFIEFKEKLRINNKSEEKLMNKILLILEDCNVSNSKRENTIMHSLFEEIKRKFLLGEDISELIVVEYILYKWMEE